VSRPTADGAEKARLARKARRQAARRGAILDAAQRVLVRSGIGDFSIRAVADEADVSKPAVYYYFADRRALVSALACRFHETEVEAMLEVVGSALTGLEALGALVRARTAHYAEELDAFRMLYLWPQVFGMDRASIDEVILPGANRVNSALEARLLADQQADRIDPGRDPRLLVNVAVTASHGILAVVSGMDMVGDSTKFAAMAMAEEAAVVLMQGARSAP